MKTMCQQQWLDFIDQLIQANEQDIIGVQAKGKRFHFAPLESAQALRLDHDVTILPPKKHLLPPHEALMTFDISRPFEVLAAQSERPQILIGVHPYDMIAIQQMDTIYLAPHVDDLYEARRKNTLIIVSDILKVSGRSFAGSLGMYTIGAGYDLLVTDLGETVLIQAGSAQGKMLLERFGEYRDARPGEVERMKRLRQELPGKYRRKLKVNKYRWSELLAHNYEHPIWQENARKCLGCGSCTLVCPTCFCYDVSDVVAMNMQSGQRVRTWDGCLLRDFTRIGSGEVLRPSQKERYRHRFYRKGLYLPSQFGFVACVGCGRCASQCLPDIADPLDVMNTLAAASMDEKKKLPIPPATRQQRVDSIMIPRSATIIRKEKMTDQETFYEIELDSGTPLGHKPGQFVEVSLFGIGEAPISVSSAPETAKAPFELLIRQVGNLTKKLATLSIGDKVGIRGPFGNGFDVQGLLGQNLLFIAGGCGMAPLRSLMNYVLGSRSQFGEIILLYGCKDPDSILFDADIKIWKSCRDIVQKYSVDFCPEGECWDGNIGVITQLIPLVDFNPDLTKALVVGPPVMYRFVIEELKKRGMPDENIMVSLERRMKCGVGKCGHCQFNGVYVCRDGPVFNYKDIKDLPEAF